MMHQIPFDCLVRVLGEYQDSPRVALAFSLVSKTAFDQMDQAWAGLYCHWSQRFGDKHPELFKTVELQTYRKSKRLKNSEYYTTRFQFLRLLRLATHNANELCPDIANFPQAGFVMRLKRSLAGSVPIWPNTLLAQTALLAKNLCAKQALSVVQELVLVWKLVPDSSLLCIASAKGYDQVLEFLLQNMPQKDAAWKQARHKHTFALVRDGERRRISGTFTALGWAQAVHAAFLPSKDHLALRRCMELLNN